MFWLDWPFCYCKQQSLAGPTPCNSYNTSSYSKKVLRALVPGEVAVGFLVVHEWRHGRPLLQHRRRRRWPPLENLLRRLPLSLELGRQRPFAAVEGTLRFGIGFEIWNVKSHLTLVQTSRYLLQICSGGLCHLKVGISALMRPYIAGGHSSVYQTLGTLAAVQASILSF